MYWKTGTKVVNGEEWLLYEYIEITQLDGYQTVTVQAATEEDFLLYYEENKKL